MTGKLKIKPVFNADKDLVEYMVFMDEIPYRVHFDIWQWCHDNNLKILLDANCTIIQTDEDFILFKMRWGEWL